MSLPPEEQLATIASLTKAGDHDTARRLAVEVAHAHPDDAEAQLAAAYACDRLGEEAEAVSHYEAASRLGVPPGERLSFLICFGSTLRNVGRTDEAVAHLSQAASEFPDEAEVQAFLALALHSAGNHANAMATMLKAALQAARPDGFGPYTRALTEYQAELAAMDPAGSE